jgi:hypothetical protein
MFVRLSYVLLNSGGFDLGEKKAEECGEGAATVAEGELGSNVELCHGLVLVGEKEERIIAEAVGASWRGYDLSFDGAVADAENVSVAGCGEDAVVTGFRILDGDFAKGVEEVEVVALVCGCFAGEREVLIYLGQVIFGVASGANAGGSVEGVYFEAGVVGYDDLAGGVVGVEDGFEAGVALESGFVFSGSGNFFYAGEWSYCGVLCCCCGEVTELARVGGGDVDQL